MNEKNNSTSYLGVIIFLVIFAGIAFGVTFKLAKTDSILPNDNQNFVNSGDNINTGNPREEDLGVKSLSEVYYTNNIEIIKEKYTEGELVKEKYSEYYPLQVEYIQIDGLKDEKIEEKINKEIKELAFKSIPEKLDKYTKYKSVYTVVFGNFSNILSLEIYNNIYKNNVYLNYDLTTGNQIKLEECFVKNAQIKNMIRTYMYDQSDWYDFESNDDKVFFGLYNFTEGNYYYYITPTSIELIIGKESSNGEYVPTVYARIDIADYYKEIALFNRFTTDESIFTNEYSNAEKKYIGFGTAEDLYEIKDNVLIYFISYEEDYRDAFNDYILNGDNFKVSTTSSSTSAKEKYEDEMCNIIQKKIEHILKQAETEQDLMHIYGINLSQGYYSSEGTYLTSAPLVFKFELKKSDYESGLKEGVVEALRTYRGGMVGTDLEERFKKVVENYENTFCSIGESSIILRENSYSPNIIYDYNNYHIDTSNELIKDENLEYIIDLDALNIIYNSIFAKYGHDFASQNLREYFECQIWYLPIEGKTVSIEELNDIEKQNLKILKAKIDELKGS